MLLVFLICSALGPAVQTVHLLGPLSIVYSWRIPNWLIYPAWNSLVYGTRGAQS